jgi:hypothetical protein
MMIVLIGPTWLTANDGGTRRLDSPVDFVRCEVIAALDRGVFVLPVLLDGATPPTDRQLPAGMSRFASLRTLNLRNDHRHDDLVRLNDTIRTALGAFPP